jgi:hypothetical protein
VSFLILHYKFEKNDNKIFQCILTSLTMSTILKVISELETILEKHGDIPVIITNQIGNGAHAYIAVDKYYPQRHPKTGELTEMWEPAAEEGDEDYTLHSGENVCIFSIGGRY